jgi:hypothetical protein
MTNESRARDAQISGSFGVGKNMLPVGDSIPSLCISDFKLWIWDRSILEPSFHDYRLSRKIASAPFAAAKKASSNCAWILQRRCSRMQKILKQIMLFSTVSIFPTFATCGET